MGSKNKPNELTLTRLYRAPVKTVWDAWNDPVQAAKWWGPRGYTITHHSKELKPGGTWRYTMHGPDGTDYPNIATYHEVEKYSRLVYDHGATETTPPLFRVTVNFSEPQKGQTLIEMTMAFESAERAIELGKFIKQAGGNATWDRLAEHLAKEEEGRNQFVINRSFNVPVETMFKMWTETEHFSKWLPPTGFTMKFIRSEPKVRAGLTSFYSMGNGAGVEMYGRVQYLEVQAPDRLVYTQQFCDQDEKISRHPFAPTWPETMLTKVELHAEGPEQTRVTITWEPQGAVTAEELAAFLKERGGMTQGWTGSFDKLEEYLLRAG